MCMLLKYMRGYLFLSALILYVINLYTPITIFQNVLNYLSVIIILLGLIGIGRVYGLMAFVFFGLGLWMVIQTGIGWQDVFLGFDHIMYVILFIGVLPLLSMPLKIGDYLKHIQRYTQILATRISTFKTTNVATFAMSTLISMASAPIIYSFFVNDRTNEIFKKRIITLISRAGSLAVYWSPVSVGVPMTVSLTGASLESVLICAFTFALGGVWYSGYIAKKTFPVNEDRGDLTQIAFSKKDIFIMSQIIGPYLVYVSILLYLVNNTDYGMINIIVLNVLPLVIIWCIFLGRFRAFCKAFNHYLLEGVSKNYSQFTVLLCAGFCLYIFDISGLMQTVESLLPSFPVLIEAPIYILVIVFLIIFLGQIGVQQFVALLLVASIFGPSHFDMHQTVYALSLLTGFGLSRAVSPFSAINIMLSTLSNQLTSYEVARMNYKFAYIFSAVIILLLIIMNYVLLYVIN